MKEITAFRAADGKLFESAAQARAHEKELAPTLVLNLTAAQVEAALSRTDTALADAIETLGDLCKAKRIEQGERHRKPKAAKDSAEPAQANGDGFERMTEAELLAGLEKVNSDLKTLATAQDAGPLPAHLDMRAAQ